MKILHLGNGYFNESFKQLGHDAKWAGSDPSADVRIPARIIRIESVLQQLPVHWNPDLVVLGDQSTHPLIVGLESLPVPLVWYAIDSHIHVNWHMYYGTAFDIICVAQKDWVPAYHMDLDRQIVSWLPLFCHHPADSNFEIERDIVLSFIGTLNPRLNPDRVEFIRSIQERFPIVVRSGDYRDIFNKSMMVLNQSVANDINFRTFQAMACGALLLNERIGNGFNDLFQDRQHCVTYEKGNVDEILDLVAYYQAHRTEREMIAREGHDRVMAAHTSLHRAHTILEMVRTYPVEDAVQKRLSRQTAIQWSLASAYELSASCYRHAATDGQGQTNLQGIASAASQYEALARAIRSHRGAGVARQLSVA